MLQRGRKGAKGGAIASGKAVERSPAPEYFNVAQRKLWSAVVASRAADYFDAGSLPLLEQYVALVIEQRLAIAAKSKPAWQKRSEAQRRADDRAMTQRAAAIDKLAISMRLAQKATYTPRTANAPKRRNKALGAANGSDAPWLN